MNTEESVIEANDKKVDDFKRAVCACFPKPCQRGLRNIGVPCKGCGTPCTYQPTVRGRPLYRCEWAILQHGPTSKGHAFFLRNIVWMWTCSLCGTKPILPESDTI